MGKSDLPDMYTQARGHSLRAWVHIRQITSAHDTTDMYHA